MDLIESPQGKDGELYQAGATGALIRRGVSYRIEVYAMWKELPGGQRVRGVDETTLDLSLTSAEVTQAMRSGKPLTLHLEDDRWLDFLVLSSSGHVSPAGAIRDKR